MRPVLLLLTLFRVITGDQQSVTVDLISDFLLKLNAPTKINAHICWPKEEQIALLKRLSSSNFGCRIGNFNNISYSTPAEHQLFLLDLSCKGSEKILNKASELNLFNQPFRWLMWGVMDRSILDNFYIRLDSRVFIVEKTETDAYRIESPYKVTENSLEYSMNHVAEWNRIGGFSVYRELSYSRNRSNLMGLNINISYVVTNKDTMNHLEDYRNKHIDPISKLNWFIMKHLISVLNATSTPLFQPSWGYRDVNDSTKFTGMIGDLQSGKAEFGGTALFFTIDRIDVIEYIAPSVPTFMKFIFRAPPLSYVSNVFTLPFDTYVWYSCFGLVPLIFVVVYVIVVWEWKDPVFKEKVGEMHANCISPLRPSFIDVLVMELGAITQQGTDTEPKSNAGRIATVFAFIACMFLYTSYSANIVAILQSTTESIKTLDDLLNSRISLGVEDIVYAHYYFKTAEEPVRKAIYQQKIAPKGQKPNFMTIEDGMSRVQKGFFAFHVEVSNGYKVVADTFQENEKCSLKEIAFINLVEPWVSIKRASPYKEIVKVGLRKILESGIQRREINQLYTKKPVCHSKGSNFDSASILDCYAAFLIFGAGLAVSFLCLTFEILLHRKFKRLMSSNVVLNYELPNDDELAKSSVY